LLLEELKCNKKFTDWFLERSLGIKDDYTVEGAWHSITHSGFGESDLVFKIRIRDEVILFLIENKIDSGFMPDQAQRYRKRGSFHLEEGECTSYRTLLFAPESYIQNNKDFDHYLKYEDFRDWLLSDEDMGERGKFKAEILTIAIERLRRDTAIINEKTTKFKWDYYNYINKHYPYLKMNRPANQMPKRTGFIRFQPPDIGLGKNEYLIHKKRGDVDLQLTRDNVEPQYVASLQNGMEIVKTGKSHSIRIKTTPVDIEEDFAKQFPAIEEAIKKVVILYDWARDNVIKIL
jgi:hypothetical protein